MDQKSPKRWWKPPSFEDFTAVESPSKRIKLDSVKKLDSTDEIIRIVVDEPKTIKDLATHPKKVEEVKNWLDKAANVKAPMLLVTGPAGSAKTTTVKIVASSLNYSVKEWVNPVDKIDFKEEKIFDGDPYDKFGYFENRQIEKFEEFIFRSSRYKTLFEGETKSVIVLEDIPNIFIWRPKTFYEFLGKYQETGKSPIIFICTDDQNLNIQNDLFPSHITSKFNISIIKFNPVNHTALMKVLKGIMEKYSDKAAISNETLESISQNSNGDIRSAISGLQILLIGVKPTRTKINRKKKDNNLPSYKPVTMKDTNMDFYHAIGKVLYPKRATDKEKLKFENKNRIFLNNVFEIADNYTNSFLTLLQENYIHTFSRLHDVIEGSDVFSICDAFGGNDDLKCYESLLSVTGLMVKNKESSKGKFRPLKKSNWTTLSKKNNLDKLTHYKDFHVTYRMLELDVISYLKFLPGFRDLLMYDDLKRLPTSELSKIVVPSVSQTVSQKIMLDDEDNDNMEIEDDDD